MRGGRPPRRGRRLATASIGALLLALALGAPAAAQDPAAARERARAILAEDRYRGSDLPQPFRDPLRRLGDAVARGFDWIAERLPGGDVATWALVGAVVVAAAALVAARLSRRQGARRSRERESAAPPRERAAELRRRAAAAERAGDLDTALRLHFRAGLLELDAAGVVRIRAGMRNGDILRLVPSPALADVAHRVERVAYGGRPATSEDLAAADAAWARVREEARAA